MKVTTIVFKPRFAPHFAPHFAPKINVWKALRRGSAKGAHMGLLRPVKQIVQNGMCMLGGMGLGAGLMYIFDPDRGGRRRATVRDECVQLVHEAGDVVDKGLRDINNRVAGKAIELVSLLAPENVSDDVLASRVRTALGRCVSHAHAIEVKVAGGNVVLTGHILQKDLEHLILGVGRVRGVRSISDEMTVHEEPGDVPDLQGQPRPVRERLLLDPRWTPAKRLGVAVAGSFLAAYGMRQRGIFAFGYRAAGLAMLLRALKKPAEHHFAARHELELGVDMQKTINIDAPLATVFNMLADPLNFPKFMAHVHQVKKLEDNQYRWTVLGPAGTLAHWDAEILKLVPNELLEWRTKPGSMVEHAGIVRFDPTPYGGTRIHVTLSYRPPLGAVGKALAEFFSFYPKHMLDDDLARFKSLMEQGRTSAHHHKVRLDELATAD